MLTAADIQQLVRELSGTNVLSVYLETRVTDPAMREVWRPALTTALRDAAARVPEQEMAEFERAKAEVLDAVPPLGGTWGAEGWMAFVTADGPRYTGELPTRVPTLAVWRKGPLVAPYMRVLKEHRPVIVALVDSRSARVYRYGWGSLEELPEMGLTVADDVETELPSGADRGGGASYPAPRSATGSEQASRRQSVNFERLAGLLGARLAELAADDGWILIGGTPEPSRLAGAMLPARVADRATVMETLEHDATAKEIAEAAQRTATQLRAAHGRAILTPLLEDAGAGGRAASSLPSTQRALRAHAVDLLVVTPTFVRTDAEEAEEVVRTALLQGADVEVLSADAADDLDARAGGIAARLRFPVG
jgi:hypothetical protein